MKPEAEQPLLLVHAHPDDEVLGSGGIMARHAAGGGRVTLVTCTLGEEGEILLPEIAHLATDRDGGLERHRAEELAASMAALGVTDSRLLGGAGRYRDSGMMGTASNDHPDAFWRADLREAAADLVPVIREVRPAVLVTYDDFGGYGHPDHIQAHRVAMYAAMLAAVPGFRPELGPAWDIPKIYWTAFPVSAVRAGIEELRRAGDNSGFAALDPEDLPFVCPDEVVTTAVDVSDFLSQKTAAMRAHASQINLAEGFFALSDNVGSPVFGHEFFRLVKGTPGGSRDSEGREADIFG